MNQFKFLRSLILILILIVLLTACVDMTNADKTNSNVEISQDQPIDNELDYLDKNKFESNSEDFKQSINNGDNEIYSSPDATETDSNQSTSNGDNDGEKPPKQSTPSVDPANPSIDVNDQQVDSNLNVELTYKEYMAMSPSEQKEYYDSYDNFLDFFTWYNDAKSKYDAVNESIEIEGGNIDISDIMDRVS